MEVQRPLIAITVLPLTGIFSMYSYWPCGNFSTWRTGINTSSSIQVWTKYEVTSALHLCWHIRESTSSGMSHLNLSFLKHSFAVLSNPLAWLFCKYHLPLWPENTGISLVNLLQDKVCQHISETKEPQQALLPAAALVYMDNDLLQIQFQFLVLNLSDAIKKKKRQTS